VFALVSLKSQAEESLRQFEDHMRALPEVRECHMLNGEIDFILKIVSRDLQSFQEFLTSKLTPAPNVASVKTSLTIRTAKQPGVARRAAGLGPSLQRRLQRKDVALRAVALETSRAQPCRHRTGGGTARACGDRTRCTSNTGSSIALIASSSATLVWVKAAALSSTACAPSALRLVQPVDQVALVVGLAHVDLDARVRRRDPRAWRRCRRASGCRRFPARACRAD
jgi:hypothetical protein